MKKIGFGIIGIGRQGQRLAGHIRNDIRNAYLVAVCQRSGAPRTYPKKSGIRYYPDYHALLNDNEVDAVIIATPSGLHGVQALDALKAGKHLLIDKPIASTVRDGKAIQVLARKYRKTVSLNFPLRVNPVTRVLRKHLPSIGRLATIQVIVSHGPVRNRWQRDFARSQGGVILDLGSHYFDLISYVTGSQPSAVIAASSEKAGIEDSGFIDLIYDSCIVSMALLRNQKMKKSVIVCAGTKGLIIADYSDRAVTVSTKRKNSLINCPSSYDFHAILTNLVRAINNKEGVVANAEAGINSLRTALSVYRSVRSKKRVRIQ